nr:MAG TPA: hypothetical protein [Caudoviricetes sp.]
MPFYSTNVFREVNYFGSVLFRFFGYHSNC